MRLEFFEENLNDITKDFLNSFLEENGLLFDEIMEYNDYLYDCIDTSTMKTEDWNFYCKSWKRKDGDYFYPMNLLLNPPDPFIIELLNRNVLTLFKCVFIIGFINHMTAIIYNSRQIVFKELATGIINPRSPDTFLTLNKTPPIRNNEKVTPNLSWLLTFEEAEAWAVNSFGVSFKELRDRLANERTNTETSDTTAAYLDKSNPMFSRELSIAIEAWEQVLANNPSRPKTGSRKNLILAWLNQNHRGLSSQAKERIATMINPDSNGGSPKIEQI